MDLAVIAIAYLLGSIPSAYLFTRALRGQDIRRIGSGNVGGMNAARNAGLPVGIATGVADVAKGLLAVALARRYGSGDWVALAAAVSATAGHNWMLFLKFRGGKGIATSLGALAVLAPVTIPYLAATGIATALLLGDTYVGVVAGYLSIPVALHFIRGGEAAWTAFGAALAAVVIAKHLGNLREYLAGRKTLV